jgi:hypothetical protein
VLLRVFENGVLRRIFGLKTDQVTGEWRKLHDEELEKNDMGGACSTDRGDERGIQGCDGET